MNKTKPHRTPDNLKWFGDKFPLSHAICSVCGAEMNLKFEIHIQFSCVNGPYAHVNLVLICTDGNCGYREITKGEAQEEGTIFKLQDLALSFRGAEMHHKGSFRKGYVALKRVRKTKNGFVEVPAPTGKKSREGSKG